MIHDPPNRWETGSTFAIVVLTIISSLFGLYRDNHYAVATDEITRFVVQDLILLVVVIPVLVIGLIQARRSSIRGRIIWLGGLVCMVYMWIHHAFVVPYSDFFLVCVVLVSLSVFTTTSGIVRTDPELVSEAIERGPSMVLYSGFLGLTAIALGGLWLSEIIPALLDNELPAAIVQFGPEATHTYVIDLGFLVPALGLTAVWTARDQPWWYVFTGVLLVFAALIAPILTAITFVDLQEGVEISIGLLLGSIIPPMIGLILSLSYLKRIESLGAGQDGAI